MDLSICEMIARIAIGAIIGFLIGLTGIGGGVLVMPALTLCLGLPPSAAVGTASLYAFLTKIMAAIKHISLKNVDFKTCGWLLLGAIPGNILVAMGINQYLKIHAMDTALISHFQSSLQLLIAAVIVVAAVILIMNVFQKTHADGTDKPSRISMLVNRSVTATVLAGIIFGAVVGGLIGSTSVGGGVILIPILISIFGLTANKTVGSSIIIGVALTLVTAIVFGKGGQLDIPTAVLMGAGSLLGVHPGSKLASTMKSKTLKLVMVGMVIAAGIMMLMK